MSNYQNMTHKQKLAWNVAACLNTMNKNSDGISYSRARANRAQTLNLARILRDEKNEKLTIAEVIFNDHKSVNHAVAAAMILVDAGLARKTKTFGIVFTDNSDFMKFVA